MPHEEYIKKRDLNAFQLNDAQEQNTSEEWKAYHKMQDAATALQNDKRTQLLTGKKKEDSPLMKDVKDATEAITQFYTKTTISEEEDEFENQIKIAMDLYAVLQKNCKKYLDQRGKDQGWKRFRMGEGYRRRCMVEKTLARVAVEKNLLENRARLVFEEFSDVTEEEERPLWVNVLAETRTRYLDFSNLEEDTHIEYTGGNTSTVLKLVNEKKGKAAYIKEEEMNVPAHIMTAKYIQEYLDSDFVKEMEKDGTTKKEISEFLDYLDGCCQYSEFINKYFINSNEFLAENFLTEENQAKFKNMMIKAADNNLLPLPQNIKDFLDNKYAAKIAGEFGAYYYRCNLTFGIATGMARIAPSANITMRNVAMYRLAELLGIADIIPATMRVKYKDTAGKAHHGILMAEAKGKPFYVANEELRKVYEKNSLSVLRRKKPTAKAEYKYDARVYLQLNSLQVLDILAAQVDRHYGNIIVERSGNSIVKAKGIDNDMCFGTLTYEQIVEQDDDGINHISQNFKRLRSDKKFLLRVLDRNLYENLLALDDNIVTYAFTDLLSKDELKCLLNRIHAVQKVFSELDLENDDVKICTSDELTEEDEKAMQHQEETIVTSIPTDVAEKLKKHLGL